MEHLFGAEITGDPSYAKKAYDAHLAKAQWMTHTGYRLLLGNWYWSMLPPLAHAKASPRIHAADIWWP
jgi:hypothetical protein